MGVYIKGMEMPKDSKYVDVRIFNNGTATTSSAEEPFYKKMDVVEVPPHGRLIDADWYGDPLRWQGDEYSGLEIVEMIKDWETIIEAEET